MFGHKADYAVLALEADTSDAEVAGPAIDGHAAHDECNVSL